MKIKIHIKILIPLILINLFSCSPVYQVLETSSPDTKPEKELFIFENNDVKIDFNFWSDGGSISFYIYNKLDRPIYIDWNKSHLIYNGNSYEYWIDSEQTKTFYSSSTSINTVTSMNTLAKTSSAVRQTSGIESRIEIKPKKIIHIPSKSRVFVSKFSIRNNPYYNCDFNLKSIISKTEFKTKNFTQEDSPINFRNYITYSVLENFDESKIIDNQFYISSIKNMTFDQFLGKIEYKTKCDYKGIERDKMDYSYPYKKSNSFYIKTMQ